MRNLTTLLDVVGLALVVLAGWLLAGGWLAALIGGAALLWVSRSLSGAPPVQLRRAGRLAAVPDAGRRAA